MVMDGFITPMMKYFAQEGVLPTFQRMLDHKDCNLFYCRWHLYDYLNHIPLNNVDPACPGCDPNTADDALDLFRIADIVGDRILQRICDNADAEPGSEFDEIERQVLLVLRTWIDEEVDRNPIAAIARPRRDAYLRGQWGDQWGDVVFAWEHGYVSGYYGQWKGLVGGGSVDAPEVFGAHHGGFIPTQSEISSGLRLLFSLRSRHQRRLRNGPSAKGMKHERCVL